MKPTTKQLAFLRVLADRSGETFTYPQTKQQASGEIRRLQNRPTSTRTERTVERRNISSDFAEAGGDARVRDHELVGHGSSAHWAGDPDDPTRRRLPVIGRRVELARYRTTAGERIVSGQRIDGVVRVIDKPTSPAGRSFLVERGLTSKTELDALVAEYVARSIECDEPAVLDGQARNAASHHA